MKNISILKTLKELAAKKAVKYRGRKTVITKKLIAEVKYLKQIKMLSISQIVKITGRSRNTIYKVLKEHLGYVSNRLVKNIAKGKNETT